MLDHNINPLFMIPAAIPIVQEPKSLFFCNGLEKPAYLTVTVDSHPIGKQGMAKGKIGIILSRIVFIHNQIRYKIHEETIVLWKPSSQKLRQLIFIQYITDDCIGPNS